MNELAGREFERILIIKPSSPGDIIHALPVLHALRRRYPRARLVWLIATAFIDLLEADPAVDELISFDRKHFGRIGRSWTATRDFVRFLADLRRRRFDLVVDLQGLFRSGFFAWATRALTRIGPPEVREFGWLFYSHRSRRPAERVHAADRNYAVAEMLGLPPGPASFPIGVTEADQSTAAALLGHAGIGEGQPYVVLVPGTRWETKRWPTERFGEVAARLRGLHGLRSILVGAASDAEAGETAAAASDGSAVNLCGQTTLRQLAAVVRGAALVITADSTPMHMAVAFGRPLVALFGPTDPRRTGPYDRLADVLRLDLACSPCGLRRLRQCPYDHACLRDLSVDIVVNAAGQRLLEPAGNVERCRT